MREFVGKTYRGRQDNVDIDQIQLWTVVKNLISYVTFYAITKEGSANAGSQAFVEGVIRYDKDVDIHNLTLYDLSAESKINLSGLSNSLLNAFTNLAYPEIKKSHVGRKRGSGQGEKGDETVSDKPDENKKVYTSHILETENDIKAKRSRYAKIGFAKMFAGKRVPVLPCIAHLEDFTPQELFNLGFDLDGTPSTETVRDFSELSEEEKEYLIERHRLQPIEAIRMNYDGISKPERRLRSV